MTHILSYGFKGILCDLCIFKLANLYSRSGRDAISYYRIVNIIYIVLIYFIFYPLMKEYEKAI